MSATASRIALSAPQSVSGVQGDAPTVSEPARSDSEGTRLLPRRDHGGRFAPRATYPCCEGCGWTLAEDLCARTYCPHPKCDAYRKPVSVVQGAAVGTLTPADIEAPGE